MDPVDLRVNAILWAAFAEAHGLEDRVEDEPPDDPDLEPEEEDEQ